MATQKYSDGPKETKSELSERYNREYQYDNGNQTAENARVKRHAERLAAKPLSVEFIAVEYSSGRSARTGRLNEYGRY